MSHSGAALSAMKVMIVVMVMALLATTSHCININGSIVSGGYSSSSRCNGLTATACRIAFSELDFDLEFMLDSEFGIRLLAGDGSHPTIDIAPHPEKAASCNRQKENDCHNNGNNIVPPDCKPGAPTNRNCYRHGKK